MFIGLLHSFINIFAGGRSEIKIALFFIYILLLTAVYFLFRKKPLKKYSWKYFGFGVLLMYLYGLILQIFYTINNNLSFWDFFITGSNGEISCSSFNHTHIAKAVIGVIFSYFGKTVFKNSDVGGSYLNHFPNLVFLSGSILLLILILGAIFYFATSFRLFFKEKNKRQKFFIILGYALISFSTIKTSIDGGIFHPAFTINLIFITLFALKEKKESLPSFYYITLSAIGLFLALIGWKINFSSFYLNSNIIAQAATLFLLYTVILYNSEKKIKLWFQILLILFLIVGWQIYAISDFYFFNRYSSAMVNKGTTTYLYNKEKNETEIFKVNKRESVSMLATELNKNIYYLPITVPGVNCQNKQYSKVNFILISNDYLIKNIFSKSNLITITNDESVKYNNKWRTNITVIASSCLPEELAAINGELKKTNITDYILITP